MPVPAGADFDHIEASQGGQRRPRTFRLGHGAGPPCPRGRGRRIASSHEARGRTAWARRDAWRAKMAMTWRPLPAPRCY